MEGSDLGSGIQIRDTRTLLWTDNSNSAIDIDVDLTFVTENGRRIQS